jgi:cell shape-determining protein MreC
MSDTLRRCEACGYPELKGSGGPIRFACGSWIEAVDGLEYLHNSTLCDAEKQILELQDERDALRAEVERLTSLCDAQARVIALQEERDALRTAQHALTTAAEVIFRQLDNEEARP